MEEVIKHIGINRDKLLKGYIPVVQFSMCGSDGVSHIFMEDHLDKITDIPNLCPKCVDWFQNRFWLGYCKWSDGEVCFDVIMQKKYVKRYGGASAFFPSNEKDLTYQLIQNSCSRIPYIPKWVFNMM